MLQKEVNLVREAAHHHVVSIIDQYEDDEFYFIVMNPLAKCDLQRYLDEAKSFNLDTPEAWESFGQRKLRLFHWMHSFAATLRHLHDRNICHRDIKPRNILVGMRSLNKQIQEEPSSKELYLADFGISFAHDGQTRTTLTTTIGSNRYEPPEALGDGTRVRRSE
jgi:serine/threonine protein kinase